MEANDLINRHCLKTATFLSDAFWEDMEVQLMLALTSNAGRLNPAVRAVKRLWDKMALHSGNKCMHVKAWNYFYATRIAPIKNTQTVRPEPDKKRNWFRRLFGVMFLDEPKFHAKTKVVTNKEDFVMHKAMAPASESKMPPEVIEAMQLLGLTIGELTVDFVLRKYRKKALHAHPDRGGTSKMFHAATAAKTLLLNWVKDGG